MCFEVQYFYTSECIYFSNSELCFGRSHFLLWIILLHSYFDLGEFQCPVLNKVFTEFTHIVAIKTTGNVFCYEVSHIMWRSHSQCPFLASS